jgi:peptidoglycan-N-acetylglucosamine deacetylase
MKKGLKYGGIVVLLLAAGFVVFWQVSRARTFQLMGEIVPRINTSEKVVALTFDDGPTTEGTAEVLAILKDHHIKASFFLIGADIQTHPESVKQIIAAGHEIGNHSYSHERMIFQTPSFIQREIDDTDRLIREAGYEGTIHFRPPYGKKFFLLPYYLAKRGKKSIMWDVEPESDQKVDGNTQKLTEQVLAQTQPGSIILLHVMYKSREPSMNAISPIIQGLKERGYEFKTVSELLALNH